MLIDRMDMIVWLVVNRIIYDRSEITYSGHFTHQYAHQTEYYSGFSTIGFNGGYIYCFTHFSLISTAKIEDSSGSMPLFY